MKYTLLLMLILSALLVSCADENSQIEELMEANEASLPEQLKILNNKGEFYNFNLKILNGNDPIEGATVVLSSSKSGQIEEISSTSDANGDVFFTNFSVGGNFITISKEGYYSVNGIINFRFEEGYNYEIVNGRVVPIERNETAILPLYSKDGNKNTAVISGKVTYEKNLTNDEPEYPVGKIIRADFTSEIMQSSEGIHFEEYTISSDDMSIGSGAVQENGSYELIIPTTANGTSVRIITPEIRENQRFAWYNNDTEQFEYTEKEARFGKSVDYNYVPVIPGAIAKITEPPIQGSGFQISDLRKVGRKIFEYYTPYIHPTEFSQINNFAYSFTPGSGYKETPSLEVIDPTGSRFKAVVDMEAVISGVELTQDGKYEPNGLVDATFFYEINGNRRTWIYIEFIADENGNLTQEQIDSDIDYYVSKNEEGFGGNYQSIGSLENLEVEFRPSYAENGVTSKGEVLFNARIEKLACDGRGINFTDPEFNFIGGDPDVPANFEFKYFGTLWGFSTDNSNVTQPYVVEPNISFEYSGIYGSREINNLVSTDSINQSYRSQRELNSYLVINEDGLIKFESGEEYYTSFYSDEKPSAIIEEPIAKTAWINLSIHPETGEIHGLNSYYNGMGYNEPFDVEIVPSLSDLPGNGAEVSIIEGDYTNKGEYRWRGQLLIRNNGEGYKHNINVFARPFSTNGSEEFEILPGEEIYRDIDYGSGRRIME